MLGHEWAVEILRQHIARDSVRHAYLLTGPPGLGRRSLALRFAQALECPNSLSPNSLSPKSLSPGEPCLTCRTCGQIERMQYADLAVVQAEKEGGVLRVEQVRAVRQSLALKPYQGRYRLALFLRFQEANANAANALLKTLEEAPQHAVLVLTADSPESLLPTVVSRCEVLRLRPLPVERLESALAGRGADPETARLLAHISGGRPGYAFRLLQDPQALEFRRRRLDELQGLLKASRRERFAYAEKLTDRKSEAKERFRETLLVWLSFWRDVLLCSAGPDAAASSLPLTNVDRLAEIEPLASGLGLAEARRMVRQAEAAVERLERNVNPRLLAEVLLLDWPR
jgi:DNA polymerase-3 subunit delta'